MIVSLCLLACADDSELEKTRHEQTSGHAEKDAGSRKLIARRLSSPLDAVSFARSTGHPS
jgi:hypothetical protein